MTRLAHLPLALLHGFMVGLWGLMMTLGALVVSPFLVLYEFPAARRYLRIERM